MRVEDLKKESGRWEQAGIISAEQRGSILALYPEKKSGTAALMFAGLGAALTGAGIILIFAVNWGKMPVPVRLAAAFAPLLCAIGYAAWTLLRRYSSAAFRETAGIFLSLGVYAALALIAQTFHDSRDMPAFVLACTLLTLPGAYLLNSAGAAAIYSAGAIFSGWNYPGWAALLLCAAIIPLFVLKLFSPRFKAGQPEAHIPLEEKKFGAHCMLLVFSAVLVNIILIVFFRICDFDSDFEVFPVIFICAQILLLLDAAFMRYTMKETAARAFLTPPRALAQGSLILLLLISAVDSSWFLHYRERCALNETAVLDLLITITLAACYVLVRFLFLKQKKIKTIDLYTGICLLLQLLTPRLWLPANIILFALGIYYIFQGGKNVRLRHLNAGMLLVMYIIVLRFFDMNLSLLQRGIVFIVLGAAFFAGNILMSKKKRKTQTDAALPIDTLPAGAPTPAAPAAETTAAPMEEP